NFGIRSQQDAEFNAIYKEKMEEFKNKILTDDVFASTYGDLGFVYGKQWRHWQTSSNESIDQIKDVIHSLKTNPDSRRHIVSALNPEDISDIALPTFHKFFSFYVADGRLSCQLYQRSLMYF